MCNKQKPFIHGMTRGDLQIAMIEFAKLHVEKALKEASEVVENELEKDFLTKDSILNSYSLENIK